MVHLAFRAETGLDAIASGRGWCRGQRKIKEKNVMTFGADTFTLLGIQEFHCFS